MPDTTCAAMREGSSTMSLVPSTSLKPKAETIMIRQEPTQTSMCVRRPAAQSSRSRSSPMTLPASAAKASRATISALLIRIASVYPRRAEGFWRIRQGGSRRVPGFDRRSIAHPVFPGSPAAPRNDNAVRYDDIDPAEREIISRSSRTQATPSAAFSTS